MYLESVNVISQAARMKVEYLKRSVLSYLVASILAGAYIGIGIVLIFAIGAPLSEAASPAVKAIMGLAFGIALTLVVFAGAELFTGNNMFMTIGLFRREVSLAELLKVWGFSWAGNLLGSLLLAYLVVHSGAIAHAGAFIEKVSSAKMNLGAMQLFLRAILCNWLVCLAIWTSSRAKSDSAKCILIFWCLFAFITCSYEHSIANMTLLGMSLFAPHAQAVSWLGFFRNLFYVTLGNIVGGAFFVGALYCMATYKEKS
jgi:nitrite transporter NirC